MTRFSGTRHFDSRGVKLIDTWNYWPPKAPPPPPLPPILPTSEKERQDRMYGARIIEPSPQHMSEAKEARKRCAKFVVLTRETSGGDHFMVTIDQHPDVSALYHEPFGRGKEDLQVSLKLTHEQMEDYHLDDWADLAWEFAAARKGFNSTWPIRCAIGFKVLDYQMGGIDTGVMLAEDPEIYKIVLERQHVAEEWEKFNQKLESHRQDAEELARRRREFERKKLGEWDKEKYRKRKEDQQLRREYEQNQTITWMKTMVQMNDDPPAPPPIPVSPAPGDARARAQHEHLDQLHDRVESMRRDELMARGLPTRDNYEAKWEADLQHKLRTSQRPHPPDVRVQPRDRRGHRRLLGRPIINPPSKWPRLLERTLTPKCRVNECELSDHLELHRAWYTMLREKLRAAGMTWMENISEDMEDVCKWPKVLEHTFQYLRVDPYTTMWDCDLFPEPTCLVQQPVRCPSVMAGQVVGHDVPRWATMWD
eukprot:CAMPEP_0197843484 /NCGR_PEP_ID=MMETSP1438-20131217/381_1 /TAXON_ID=1461541 /ORGANISM="Pterosperma sp., Strain CCMP1384" /LENGTH=478 /DNA_ID=CAMNT_0043453667 /DNA_START=433 /DNA_END=1869 /DNA_ORIENTATION=-